MAVATNRDDRDDQKVHAEVHMELEVMTFGSTNRLSSQAALPNSLS